MSKKIIKKLSAASAGMFKVIEDRAVHTSYAMERTTEAVCSMENSIGILARAVEEKDKQNEKMGDGIDGLTCELYDVKQALGAKTRRLEDLSLENIKLRRELTAEKNRLQEQFDTNYGREISHNVNDEAFAYLEYLEMMNYFLSQIAPS